MNKVEKRGWECTINQIIYSTSTCNGGPATINQYELLNYLRCKHLHNKHFKTKEQVVAWEVTYLCSWGQVCITFVGGSFGLWYCRRADVGWCIVVFRAFVFVFRTFVFIGWSLEGMCYSGCGAWSLHAKYWSIIIVRMNCVAREESKRDKGREMGRLKCYVVDAWN